MQRVGARRFFWGKAPAGPRRFRASVLCRCILRPVETSDAPAGTSLHRCPARIAVFSFSSLSLIRVAGQQGDVGTYRQGASVVFQNVRMPAQRTDVDKRRDAKGRCAEVQWHPFFVDASSGWLTRRTHLPVRPYIAGPYVAVLHASPVFSHFFVSPAWG